MIATGSGNRARICGIAQIRKRIAAPLFAAALIIVAEGCGPATGPEESLRQWVRQGHAAAENKDRKALVRMISPSYGDARGNTRQDIENLFRLYFLRAQKVALITKIDDLEVIGETIGEISLSVGMAGTHDDGLGLSADLYRFEMELERKGADWQLISARWGTFGDELR